MTAVCRRGIYYAAPFEILRRVYVDVVVVPRRDTHDKYTSGLIDIATLLSHVHDISLHFTVFHERYFAPAAYLLFWDIKLRAISWYGSLLRDINIYSTDL